ncbi:tRNA (adenosine(37)-N6)-threonylcarbamoyltransferase complex ATPase subunit type 1 TsaE [Lampropedia puyangensis]|uniref:tRNA threonylcarbamoyladenosine biosynthesis protein TsaE n=1 Tax=Lampropedia puyangensis TaxID=1330072 RepID=A0A4S8F0A5_9BURK|nr:tRNA (adenosine(37)-N6)-threonylcarbamoyltransferase complex ATPase subunit type 1 TsaE [Lampropedia puyangensis]THU00678.1 tRNA (adenosine(37)-N6)-threonylcarbamoyltransferase complex ATPase subunit type 1 TsaE [Lampropedia puyangensis]
MTEEDTAQLAQCFASQAHALAQLSIHLYGNLGAGKTTWTRYLLRALGVQGRIKSPTYALLEQYELDDHSFEAYHFDLYRLEAPQEWLESGLQETVQGPGLKLIEWPQKAGELLDAPDLTLSFEFLPTSAQQRQVRLTAHSAAGQQLAESVLKCAQ